MNNTKIRKIIKSKAGTKKAASERSDTLAANRLGKNCIILSITLANYTSQKLDVEAAEMLQKKTLLDNH